MAQPDKQRAALEERQRIDQAMAIIDAAKRKALAQRVEYGKFLEWKVKMQQRERKQREEEEINLRARIDAKLKSVLEEHRERKREEVNRWKSFAEQKIRKASCAASKLERDEIAAKEEAMKRARDMSESRRLQPAPHSAPSRPAASDDKVYTGGRKGRVGPTAAYEPAVGPGAMPSALAASSSPAADGPQSEAEFLSAYRLPEIISSSARKGGGIDALSLAQTQQIAAIEQSRKKIEQKSAVMASMFQMAKSRRLYSTARMLADPPADFLMGNDLMRYIPADIMSQVDRETSRQVPASPRNDTLGFFITEADNEEKPAQTDLLDLPEQHRAGHQSGRKVGRWRQYDPHAWMATGEVEPPKLAAPPRDPAEEAATLEWYKRCCEPLTRIKKRTERHQTHTWQPVAKHVLPPLSSARFSQD